MELAGYLVDPGHRDYRIPALMSQLFISGDLSSPTGRGPVLHSLLARLKKGIDEFALSALLEQVEIPVARILVSMERTGICVSRNRIREVRGTIEERLVELEHHIYLEAGGPFSVLSPKQVGVVLYEKLGLPVQRKGKTGYSTDEETLEALSGLHPLPRLIVEYRQLRKFLSTYLGPMEEGTDSSGRLHGQFNQTVAATGRLSSSNPNLQNIPVKSDLGLLIRRCFVAPEGSLLLSADYSQIELRLLAHLSQDPFHLAAFDAGKDIHAQTAEALFGSPVTPENRRRAKTLNFAILYGMSSYSLSQDLGLSQPEAQAVIDRYFKVFEKVGPYFETIRRTALETGRIRTILGRIRPIPEILSNNRKIREYGERMAVNSVLQGSAADLIKKAMVDLDRRLTERLPSARLLIQVHDELLLEVGAGDEKTATRFIRESMEGAFVLSVPLVVSIGTGRDWVDAHPA
jgi:DNA polymerase-1